VSEDANLFCFQALSLRSLRRNWV